MDLAPEDATDVIVRAEPGNDREDRERLRAATRHQVDLHELSTLVEVGQHEPRCRRPRKDGIAERELAEAPIELACLLARIARRERFGRFGSREEIRIQARRHQVVGAVVVVLHLDPDRLDRFRRQGHAIDARALLGRQHGRGNPHATVGARHCPLRVVEFRIGGLHRRGGAACQRGRDDRGREPTHHQAVHVAGNRVMTEGSIR